MYLLGQRHTWYCPGLIRLVINRKTQSEGGKGVPLLLIVICSAAAFKQSPEYIHPLILVYPLNRLTDTDPRGGPST